MVDLDVLLLRAKQLHPLPASAVRLAGLVNSPHADLGDICEVIAYDPALTASLLRAANSAEAGSASTVSEVQEAVFRLGAARILALVTSAGARRLLKQDSPAYGLREGDLWKHSVAAAAAAEVVAEHASVPLPPETFTASLLHDIGKLIMGRYMTPNHLELIRRAGTEEGLDPLAAEAKVLGLHHGQLGGVMAQHWGLPESIVQGVTYHHDPWTAQNLLCDAVYLSNLVAKHIEGANPVPAPDDEVLDLLGLDGPGLEELIQSAREHFQVISARYNS